MSLVNEPTLYEHDKDSNQILRVITTRADAVEILETAKSTAVDFNSAVWDVSNYRTGIVMASWTGIDATNASLIMEASSDLAEWVELGGDLGGMAIDDTEDSAQGFEFTVFTMRYVRLSYQKNNVTTGSMTIKVMGKN